MAGTYQLLFLQVYLPELLSKLFLLRYLALSSPQLRKNYKRSSV